MAAAKSVSGGSTRSHGHMEIERVKSTRIYEEIVRQVKQFIADGRLKSGDRRRLRGRPAIPDLPPVH